MGRKGKDKKKGKGVEKTIAKTEKKLTNKFKKELQLKGEEDVESILAQIEKEEKKRLQVTETITDPPSRRLNFTFAPHPDKDQLILFGGEFYNGQKISIFNDLYFYNIPNKTWTLVKAPGAPPPRCGHKMVATSSNKGQIWIFGGEFASPTQSQFYHYRDLWVYHLDKKQWEKILAPNGPSARSGHRMVYIKKNLIIFGGFHDNLRDYKYFNDVHIFNTETYTWNKISCVGTPPAARSACCMVPLNNGKVLIYGGYSKERVKKDVDKGHVYNDAFLLAPEKNDATFTKFKWVQTKIGGAQFSSRCSMPITSTPNNSAAYCFGGVFDTENDDDEVISGNFYNDLYQLDLEKLIWRQIQVSPKIVKKPTENDMEIDVDKKIEEVLPTIVVDDGVFKVTVGQSCSNQKSVMVDNVVKINVFQPSARINCGLAVKYGVLYLYGGMFEDGDKQVTLNDFYCVDLKKLDEWKILIADDTKSLEWFGSDSSENESEDNDSDDDDEEDNDPSESDLEMKTD